MKKRIFLIHGWEGTPTNHWFPYLSLELKANGFEVNAPQMPHADIPKVSEWLSFLKGYVGRPDKNTYFVGHSLGCIAIARYLETFSPKSSLSDSPFPKGSTPSSEEGFKSSVSKSPRLLPKGGQGPPSFKKGGIKVGGCVFVAGFSSRINVPEIAEFYSLPFDPEKAKEHCEKFVMIFSDNDTYVPMEKSLETARELGAKTILERGKGHFTARENVTTLPSALTAVLRMAA